MKIQKEGSRPCIIETDAKNGNDKVVQLTGPNRSISAVGILYDAKRATTTATD